MEETQATPVAKKEMTLIDVQKAEAKEESKYADATDVLIQDKIEIMFDGKSAFIKNADVNAETVIRRRYARRYIEMIDEGYVSRKVLAKKLEKSGDWTKEDEENYKEVAQRFSDYFKEMNSYPMGMKVNPDNTVSKDFQDLCEKCEKAMQEYTGKTMELEGLFCGCLEMLLGKEMEFVKLSLCFVDENDQPIFKHYDDIQKYKNGSELRAVLKVATKFWQGIEERFLDAWPVIRNGGSDTKPANQETSA
jgi:hypothetical protein